MKYRIKIHRETGVILSDEVTDETSLAVAEEIAAERNFIMKLNGNTCFVGSDVVKNSLIEFVTIQE